MVCASGTVSYDEENITLGELFFWVIFGLIVGFLARWIVPGEGPGGVVGDIIIGIVGAVIGGWLYGFFGHFGITGFNLPSTVCALIGAVVLLWALRALRGQTAA